MVTLTSHQFSHTHKKRTAAMDKKFQRKYLLAQFRNALKHMLSVEHMSAYIEACTEAGSEFMLNI